MKITVKPLDWLVQRDRYARSTLGEYRISPMFGMGPKDFMAARGSTAIGYFDTMPEAMEFAQRDHEQRIHAAIDPEWT